MKKLTVLFLISFLSISLHAQQASRKTLPFIRVYAHSGKKIGKGKIQGLNDSMLVIRNNNKLTKLTLSEIGKIKTKHSAGQNFLIGAVTGTALGAILGVANAPTETKGGTFTWAGGSAGEELTAGLTAGILTGTILGGITAIFKNSKTYYIASDPEKWKIFVAEMPSQVLIRD